MTEFSLETPLRLGDWGVKPELVGAGRGGRR